MKKDQDIESSILKIIHDTKWLMERDNLIDLGEREEEIVKIVSFFLEEQVGCTLPLLKDSTFEKEKEKMTHTLIRHFNEEEIQSRYYEKILPLFWQMAGKEYVTQFRGDQHLWEILIPFSLNEISYVYMGHEVIHALTLDHHYEEWKNLYRYSECLPIFYEFMQGADLDLKSRDKIASFRMVDLLKMYQTLKDPNTSSFEKGYRLLYPNSRNKN